MKTRHASPASRPQRAPAQWLLSSAMIAASFALAAPASQAADAYPDHTVNYIIPFSPGGESDIAARLQEPFFKKYSGQTVAIQYRPGAGGAAVWSQLNGMESTGYTIVGTNLPHIVLQPMERGSGYKTADIHNIYWFQYTPDALIVPADSKYKTLKDFIQDAKARPKKITVGGTGTGSGNQLAHVRFDTMAGVQTTYVPFKGTGAVNTALLGNHVDASWGYTTVRLGLGTQVRCLGVAMPERHPAIPDCPTFKEEGFDLTGGVYRGIAVPKATPEDRQKAMADLIGKINRDPEFIKQMESKGFALVNIGPDQMAAFMQKQETELEAGAKALGLK